MDKPPPDLADLLEHRAWVERLARRLVKDPHLADDLAQDAYLGALERPSERRSPRGWLSTVVRRRLRDHRRGARRRVHRERAVARNEQTESAQELASKAEAQRLVLDTVLALVEPYREAILLRYYEGLAPNEIARKLGVPASTIRTRLARAHEQLRQELEDRGGTKDLRALLLPLLGAELGRGATAAGVGGSAAVGLRVSLVIAALLVFGIMVSSSDRNPDGRAGPAGAGGDRVVARTSSGGAAAAVPAKQPTEATSPGSPEPRLLRVVRGDTGMPIPAAEIRFVGVTLPDHRQLHFASDLWERLGSVGRTAWTDSSGEWRVPRHTGILLVAARFADRVGRALIHPAAPPCVTLRLHASRSKTVLVVDERGWPQAGMPVEMVGVSGPFLVVARRAITGTDGTAVLTELADLAEAGLSFKLRLAIAGGRCERDVDWETSGEATRLVAPPTAALEVRVSRPAYVVLAGAGISVTMVSSAGHALFPHVAVSTNLSVRAIDRAGEMCTTESAFRSPNMPGSLATRELVLNRPRPVLRGRLVDDEGRPWVREPLLLWSEESGVGGGDWAGTDEAGRFRFRPELMAGEERVFTLFHASGPKLLRLSQALTVKERALPYDLGPIPVARTSQAVLGRIVGPDGSPVNGAIVRTLLISPSGLVTLGPEGFSDHNGAFRVPLPKDAVRLCVIAEKQGVTVQQEWIAGQGAELVLTFPQAGATPRAQRNLRVRVVDHSGAAIAGAEVWHRTADRSWSQLVTTADGLADVPLGAELDLLLIKAGYDAQFSRNVDRDRLLVLEPRPTGALTVLANERAFGASRKLVLTLTWIGDTGEVMPDDPRSLRVVPLDLAARSRWPALLPGRYLLECRLQTVEAETVVEKTLYSLRVGVRAGEEHVVTLEPSEVK